MKRLLIVGDGRVARSLALSFRAAGIAFVQCKNARSSLPRYLSRERARTRGRLFVFIAVPEGAWSSLSLLLRGDDLEPISVSGSLTVDDFARLGLPKVSVFHPLMTFARPMSLRGVPVAVSSAPLRRLALAIGAKPFVLPQDRTLYHAAAVVSAAGVATTLLLARALLTLAGGTDARVLAPIAHRAIDNLLAHGAAALTGPVPRGDEATLRKHLRAMRRAAPEDQRLFRALLASMRRAWALR